MDHTETIGYIKLMAYIFIAVLVGMAFLFLYLYWRLNDKLSALDQHTDLSTESNADLHDLLQTINNRKLNHLHECIKGICANAGYQYTEPKSFLTDYEKKLMKKISGKRSDEMKKLAEEFYGKPFEQKQTQQQQQQQQQP